MQRPVTFTQPLNTPRTSRRKTNVQRPVTFTQPLNTPQTAVARPLYDTPSSSPHHHQGERLMGAPPTASTTTAFTSPSAFPMEGRGIPPSFFFHYRLNNDNPLLYFTPTFNSLQNPPVDSTIFIQENCQSGNSLFHLLLILILPTGHALPPLPPILTATPVSHQYPRITHSIPHPISHVHAHDLLPVLFSADAGSYPYHRFLSHLVFPQSRHHMIGRL